MPMKMASVMVMVYSLSRKEVMRLRNVFQREDRLGIFPYRLPISLFYRHALGQIPGLIHIVSLEIRYIVSQKLKGNGEEHRG